MLMTSWQSTLNTSQKRTEYAVGEILKGLRCYFDRALPANLLYNKERKQFQELITDNISPSTVYDAEHLLRLFVKLPELLPYVNIEKDIAMCLQQKFHDFLNFEDGSGAKGTENGTLGRKMESKRENRQYRKEAWRS